MSDSNQQYKVIGPLSSGNLAILVGDRCFATVKYDAERDRECRQLAERIARGDTRTAMLKHLLAEMQSDEGRWLKEIEMIGAELAITGDDVDT